MTYVNSSLNQKTQRFSYFEELWRYRSLCANLVGADLRARFRRSRLGIVWAVIQPLFFSLTIAFIWGVVFQVPYLEYAIYVFSGMIVWEYFANTVMASQDALINSEGYLKQGRIPFLIFQLRAPLSGFFTYVAGFLGLAGLQLVLGMFPPVGLHLLLIVPFSLLLVLFLIPIACIFSILGTQFRDLRHAMTVILNGIFFLSPVMIAREFLDSPRLEFLHYANPMMPLLDLLRMPMVEGQYWTLRPLLVMLVWVAAMWVLAFVLSRVFGRKIIFAI